MFTLKNKKTKIILYSLIICLTSSLFSCKKYRKGVCEHVKIQTSSPIPGTTGLFANPAVPKGIAQESYYAESNIKKDDCLGEKYNTYKMTYSQSEELQMSHWWEDKNLKQLGKDDGDPSTPLPNSYYSGLNSELNKIKNLENWDLQPIMNFYGWTGPTSSICFIGKWKRQVCGGAYDAYLTFNSDGTGKFFDTDCNSLCTRDFNFKWTDNGNGTMKITYTNCTICGSVVNPNGGDQAYTCNGSTLTWGNEYQKY